MTIHFTRSGIYADTEEERLAFLDRVCMGDPVIWGHLMVHDMDLANLEKLTDKPQKGEVNNGIQNKARRQI